MWRWLGNTTNQAAAFKIGCNWEMQEDPKSTELMERWMVIRLIDASDRSRYDVQILTRGWVPCPESLLSYVSRWRSECLYSFITCKTRYEYKEPEWNRLVSKDVACNVFLRAYLFQMLQLLGVGKLHKFSTIYSRSVRIVIDIFFNYFYFNSGRIPPCDPSSC